MDVLSLVQSTIVLATEVAEDGEGLFASLMQNYKEGGWGMYPITFCLVFLLAILGDRIRMLYFKANINKDAFMRGLKRYIYAGDLDKAISFVAGQKPTPLTSVVKAGLMNVPRGEAEVQAAMDEAALRENPKIEARTGYLAMIGNAAMLCGLLGTVSGLITCFRAVAHVSPADKGTILSAGISEAMNCTAFGLGTAIPALIAFSLLNGRTQHMIDDINETTVGVLNLVIANKDKLRTGGEAAAQNATAPHSALP
ncbi:MAG: MotA/TolQ/ExbB proton channel family protein, partial [Myxococcales bacterium]|nr:MotA/TolQ/ExbB proton channel family protein [Myxococcales bacterium]